MRGALTVLAKEVVDNVRDRRALASTLILGPLLGPVVFALVLLAVLDRAESERPLELAVSGANRAPNLITFIRQQGVVLRPAPDDPEAAVRADRRALVLVIPEAYAASFRAGRPATVRLVGDTSDPHGAAALARARGLLSAYGQRVGRLRLLARGVDPGTVDAVAVEAVDVATPEARSLALLGLLPYFLIFSIWVGGFHLAVDATPGERERGSLEPLLASPVPRAALMLGKLGATAVFSTVSLSLATLGFAVCLAGVPLDALGMASNFGVGPIAATAGVALPFVLFAAAALTVVATFTRSVKEAQTYLSALLFVPMAPILLTVLFPLRPRLWMMLVPGLGQHLLLTGILEGAALEPAFLAVSVAATVAGAGLLAALAARLYERERLLG